MKAFYLLALFTSSLFAATPEAPTIITETSDVARGAFGIAFKSLTNVERYAHPRGLVVAGRCKTHYSAKEMQNVRKGGGIVLQYLIPSEVPNNGGACDIDKAFYSGFGSSVPLWPYGERQKWPDTKMTDMRPDSPWLRYVVQYIGAIMREGKVDGMFLDTVGARTYAKTAEWEKWSAKEKDDYMNGNIWLVKQLDAQRKLHNPGFLIVNNSVWHREDKPKEAAVGGQYVNGSCLEHPKVLSSWHVAYSARTFNGQRRIMLIIANSQDEARAWANVPGVTHVSGQLTSQYSYPLLPPIPLN